MNDLFHKTVVPTVPSKPANMSPIMGRNIPWVPPIPKPVSALPLNLQTEKMDLSERAKFWKEVIQIFF